MQAVEINATLPNEPEKVQKPKKAENPTEGRSFLEMIKKIALKNTADKSSGSAEVGEKDLNKAEFNSEDLGSKDFDAKLKSTKTTDGKKSLGVANVLKSKQVEKGSKFEKDSKALDFEKKAELRVSPDEEVNTNLAFEGIVDDVDESENAVLLSSADDLEQSETNARKGKEKTLDGKNGFVEESVIENLRFASSKLSSKADTDADADKKGDDFSGSPKKTSKPKPLFSVEDLRTGQVTSEHANIGVHSTGTEERTGIDSSTVDFTIIIPKGAERSEGVFFTGTEARESGSSQASQSFSQLLSSELNGMNDDFLRAGKIILRDNNAGSIRLNLQPEKLGNVRIFLELSEGKKVLGKIVVASEEAYVAFKENLEGLIESFESGGFESADFDLTWTESGEHNDFVGQEHGFAASDEYEDSLQELMVKEAFADTQAYGLGQAETIDVLA
ncbi:MAG: hypothetical protein CR988_05910 [Treponema sp.]|nr:MAG: hypothetical protein CR988_05910 [Treponema sp.]